MLALGILVSLLSPFRASACRLPSARNRWSFLLLQENRFVYSAGNKSEVFEKLLSVPVGFIHQHRNGSRFTAQLVCHLQNTSRSKSFASIVGVYVNAFDINDI